MKLTPELLERGILDVCINKEPREISISYENEGQQMEPAVIPILEFPYPTIDQIGKLVQDKMNIETLTHLKGFLILKLSSCWRNIYNIQKENQKEKRGNVNKNGKNELAIKKYSQNGKIPLHEAIVLGTTPKFVTLDSQGIPEFKDFIDTPKDTLVPADSIETQNPLPYVFDSEDQFKEYLQLAKKESLDSIFTKVESEFRKYVNVEEYYYPVLVGDIIWSLFQDKFGYTHFNFFVGDNGSGKNSALLVFKYLGYRVFYVTSASAANYYTQLGNREEGQCCIAEDEAEDMAYDRDKNNVIKTGYASGGSVPKIELEGGRRQDSWLTYCHKWFAMEELPDARKMKAILDRSLVYKFIVGDVPYNIKDVIRDAGDPRYKPLYEELIHIRKMLFCFRLLHHSEPILDVSLNIKNRSAELTKPLIRLFQNSPNALAKIMDSLSVFMVERNEVKKNSFESKLYDTLTVLIEGQSLSKEEIITFKNEDIREKLKELVDGHDLADKQSAFYSPEIGEVSQTRITKTLKSKFKVKPVPKKIEGKTYRCIQLERKILDRIKSNYTIPDKIEILSKVTLVTEVTPVSRVPLLYTGILYTKIAAIFNSS